jgi:membrane protein implicated in regulation of membrane protease activity
MLKFNSMEILENLDPLLKTFWFVAIPTSIIFLIQAIMTFIGVDSSDGLEADFDGNLSEVDAPFQLFSLRNLINFLLGFSWTGISFYTTISNPILLVALSVFVGVLFIYLFFMAMKQIQKLAENNSFNILNALNKTAEVYLTIPENKKGKGKIMISVNGTFHELEAMTEKEKIQSGSVVKVVKIENNNILIVETI